MAGVGALGASQGATEPARVRLVTAVEAAATDDPAAELLFDWLVVRLLEEGYAIASGDEADVELAVVPGDSQTWIVRASGSSSAAIDVALDGDASVVRLEVLHRAIDVLVAAGRRPATQPRRTAFAFEISAAIAASEVPPLQRSIALAILHAGGVVSPSRTWAEQVVCVGPGGAREAVTLVDATAACPASIAAVEPAAAAEVAGELVRTRLGAEQVPFDDESPLVETEVPPRLVREPEPPPSAWASAPLVVRGGAAVGMVARMKAIDPALTASLVVGREPGLGAWIDLQLWPGTRTDMLRVFEAVIAAGLRVRPVTVGRFALDLGVLLGLQLHGYRFSRAPVEDRGVALDVSGELAIGFAIRLWRDHELQLLVRGGRSGREREHVLRDDFRAQPLWYRNAWRVSATLGMAFGRKARP